MRQPKAAVPVVTITNPSAAKTALATLRGFASEKEDGTWQITISAYEQMASELLANIVSFKPSIPERTARHLVFRSVFKWLRYKKYREDPDSPRGFTHAIDRELRILQRKRASITVLMFMSCDREDLRPFGNPEVLGTELEIRDWDQLRLLDTPRMWQDVKFHRLAPALLYDLEVERPLPRQGDFTPITVRTVTYGGEAAVEVAQQAFDLFRACVNLPAIAGRFSYFRSAPKALSPLAPSPIYGVFDSEGKYLTTYSTIEKYQHSKVSVTARHAAVALEYLSKLNQLAATESLAAYSRSLRLYQDAIDIASPRQSYLALWNVIESIADIESRGISQWKIESRIATLVNADPLVRYLLHVLVAKRNHLVHSGDFPQESDPLYFSLKLITDISLARLLALAADFDTPARIEEYFSLASTPDTTLEMKREVIDHVLHSRTK